jgi:Uma2 family endonuclease
MSTQPRTPVSASEYLEIERKAEYKSEYCAGEMFAMAGATEAHNILAANMLVLIHYQFRARDCRVYGSDMRVAVSPEGLYTYPDVSAACEEPRFLDQHRDTLLNPAVIVEVLSSSTEAYDRGRKFELYRTLDSIQQYVLVATDRIHVDVYTRVQDGRWVLRSLDGAADSVELDSIGCRLLVSELYQKTDLMGT